MAITTQDQLIAAAGLGRTYRADWQKTVGAAAYTAGRAYETASLAGYPVATAWPGTALVAQTYQDATGDGTSVWGIPHGGNVASLVKQAAALYALTTAATGAPSTLYLCDFLMAYPGFDMNSLATQTFINANTVTASSSTGLLLTYTNDFTNYTQVRFTNSGGALPTGLSAGVDYYLVRQGATTAKVATSLANAIAGTVIAFTDAGTGTHTMTVTNLRWGNMNGVRAFLAARATTGAVAHNFSMTYTNSAGTAGKTLPGTVSCTASAIVPHIVHSGTAANNFTPFLPLATGDVGVGSVQSAALSAASGTASTAVLALVKPITTLALSAANTAFEKDLAMQFSSLPVIPDQACLGWVLVTGAATAANTSFVGAIETVWG